MRFNNPQKQTHSSQIVLQIWHASEKLQLKQKCTFEDKGKSKIMPTLPVKEYDDFVVVLNVSI